MRAVCYNHVMALTKNDLEKIKEVVGASAEVVVARVDRLEAETARQFVQNSHEHAEIIGKIDKLAKTENEDISVVYRDVSSMKKRLNKAGI